MPNVSGSKWGSPSLGSAGGVVTWSIVGAGESTNRFQNDGGVSVDGDSIMSFDYTKAISDALNAWSKHGNIEFMQVEDQGGAAGTGLVGDIRFFFGPIPGSTIGIGFFPSSFPTAINGDILMDSLPNFNNNQTLFSSVLLHEIGHALGLGHVNNGPSIMTPSISQSELQADDIDGIQQTYGVQDNRATVYDMPGTLNNLNILESPNQVTVNGNARANNINGTRDAEVINGGGGNDTINGGGGNDTLSGGAAADRVGGADGNDVLIGGAGADRLNGGSGTDTASYASASGKVHLDLRSKGTFGDAANDTFQSIENVTGSGFGDYIYGDSANNTLNGQNGADRLRGDGGNDLLLGGAGNDHIVGGAGTDALRGGSGNDTLIGSSGRDDLNGGSGTDTASYETASGKVHLDLRSKGTFGDASNDRFTSIENVTGSRFNDYIYGNAADNLLKGGNGADRLRGDSGNDVLIGGAGGDNLNGGGGVDTASYADASGRVNLDLRSKGTAGDASNDTFKSIENVTGSDFNDYIYGNGARNTLVGGDGADRIRGDGGADWIIGGGGNDLSLIGGSGADTFVFGRGSDTDVVVDFQNNVDTIEIARSLIAAGRDAFDYASQKASAVEFAFGGSDILRVQNTTIADLTDDLVVV